MNNVTNPTSWVKSLVLMSAIATASATANAADRADIIAAALVGATAGYIFSERGDQWHLTYRYGNFHYRDRDDDRKPWRADSPNRAHHSFHPQYYSRYHEAASFHRGNRHCWEKSRGDDSPHRREHREPYNRIHRD